MSTPSGADPSSRAGTRATEPWGPRQAVGAVVFCHLVMIVAGSLVLWAGGWETPIPTVGNFLALAPFWASVPIVAIHLSRAAGRGVTDSLRLGFRWWDVPLGAALGMGAQFAIPWVYNPVLKLLGSDLDELERPARELVDAADGRLATFLLIVMTVLCAPLAEEVLYRGVVLRGFERYGKVAAVLVSGVMFGAVHLQPLQFFGLALFGILLGALAESTERLAPALFAHMAFNAVSVAALL